MEDLVVKSKVRDYVKMKDMRIGGDVFDALSERVACDLDAAAKRAKENGRKTIKPYDL